MIINEVFTNYFLWYLKKKNKSLFFGRYGAAPQEEEEGKILSVGTENAYYILCFQFCKKH